MFCGYGVAGSLVCGVSFVFVTSPYGVLGQVWYLIASTPGLCFLSYLVCSVWLWYFQIAIIACLDIVLDNLNQQFQNKDDLHILQTVDCFTVQFYELCFMFVMLSCLFIADLRSPAGKELTSWHSCMWCFIVFCHFHMWCPGSGVVLDRIDSWSSPPFLLCNGKINILYVPSSSFKKRYLAFVLESWYSRGTKVYNI